MVPFFLTFKDMELKIKVPELQKTMSEHIAEGQQILAETKSFLKLNGIEYQLHDWLTIKKYCERFQIEDTQVVTNWIRRGVIPAENVREIEELNGLRLIKAVSYR
jgi:hypothetical protein